MKRFVSIFFAAILFCTLLVGCKTLDTIRDTIKNAVDVGFSAYEDIADAVEGVKDAVIGDEESEDEESKDSQP